MQSVQTKFDRFWCRFLNIFKYSPRDEVRRRHSIGFFLAELILVLLYIAATFYSMRHADTLALIITIIVSAQVLVNLFKKIRRERRLLDGRGMPPAYLRLIALYSVALLCVGISFGYFLAGSTESLPEGWSRLYSVLCYLFYGFCFLEQVVEIVVDFYGAAPTEFSILA